MATVKEQIKGSLVGTIIEPSLSTDAQATFERKAKKDEETGELYMTEEEFVDAIAPEDEDYVSSSAQKRTSPYPSIQRWIGKGRISSWFLTVSIAQNQA